MLQRVVTGAGVAAAVLAVALWPAGTAWSAPNKVSICQAYQADAAKQQKANATLTKILGSKSWAVGKKDLLSTVNQEANAENQFAHVYLKGASSRVRFAAAVVLKLDSSLEPIIEKAKNLNQYETGINAAESTPKVQAALTVLDNYTAKLCGSTTSST